MEGFARIQEGKRGKAFSCGHDGTGFRNASRVSMTPVLPTHYCSAMLRTKASRVYKGGHSHGNRDVVLF